MGAASTVRRRHARNGRVVPAERVVVAPDQGTRPELQGLHRAAIRQELMERSRTSVLVTGAAGFVGSHLLELLEQEQTQVVAWLRPGTEPLVAGTRVIWHGGELHDRQAVADEIVAVSPSS